MNRIGKEVDVLLDVILYGKSLPRGNSLNRSNSYMVDNHNRVYWKINITKFCEDAKDLNSIRTMYRFPKDKLVLVCFVRISKLTPPAVGIPTVMEIIHIPVGDHFAKFRVTEVVGDSFKATTNIVGLVQICQ